MKENGAWEPADPSSLEESIGYRFQDRSLLLGALTHSSFCNESTEPTSDNERLEFLGDAIISTVISESAYTQFPDAREGELTRLKALVVAEPGLAMKAAELNLGRYLRLGHGAATADRAATHPGVLCDAFEALIGAVYLDGGFETAKKIILTLLGPELPKARSGGHQIDAKTELQMLTLARTRKPPVYHLVRMEGPPHAPEFVVEVRLPDGTSFSGGGRSKKQAQQAAAADALKHCRARSTGMEESDETAD
ncbi:MAG TPA: ribonuclease III [Myxococcota bacterium]|nr:ribonuclease III [Myxococcota bacterium]HNZ03863.1 ribonuclease III [Myxococcota bacterium]HOD07299.1 ribonuclease III [Myxococcota bacterium]HPB50383.1 ribonuclease III [Myxococcota bacterium]HQP95297.1 ribonuclease III [Myxococcota bacterium]